ncbi:UDP-N-acetylmuramyl pentapeptide synthase [Clostridiales Family XIII bacterium PM5-7]
MHYIKGENLQGQWRYAYDQQQNLYKIKEATALNEAAILFGPDMHLTKKMCGGLFKKTTNFDNQFAYLQTALEKADFAMSPVSVELGIADKSKNKESKVGFLKSLDAIGFDVLLYQNSVLCHGEESLSSIFEINGIKVGFAFTIDQVAKLRDCGAEYVFALDKTEKSQATTVAKQLAEAGADYVVLNQPEGISPYYILNTEDGRIVPVMGSLGQAFSTEEEYTGLAFLNVRLLKALDGTITAESIYIPLCAARKFNEEHYVLLPTLQYYNGSIKSKKLQAMSRSVKRRIGKELNCTPRRSVIKNKNGFQPQVNIKEICQILDVSDGFYQGSFPIEEKVHSIVMRNTELDKGCVAVIGPGKKEFDITPEQAKAAGAIMVIDTKENQGIPSLIVDNPTDAFIQLCVAIRKKYDPFTVAITGTVGKSTTTDLIKSVIKYDYNMLDVRGNYNHYRTIGLCIQKLSQNHTAYVQEVHGGTKGAAKLGSSMVLPNVCVITNIGDAHLSQMGTVEDVLREKLGIIDSMQPDGTLLINNDNEYLQTVDAPVHTIRYAVHNQNSDYYAQNIVDYGEKIEFQIVCKEGVFDAVIHCIGIYNVGNAIAAFAVGRLAGIAPHRLLAAISKYRTSGTRQNIIKKDGYTVFVDCYNAAPASMFASMTAFQNLGKGESGKHVAILGDVAQLSEKTVYWHKEFGKKAAELGFDVVITFGSKAMHITNVAKAMGVEAYGFTEEERDAFEAKICEVIRPGDFLLFKASHATDLESSVNHIFGEIKMK